MSREGFDTLWGSAPVMKVHSSSGRTRVCHSKDKVLLFLVDMEPPFSGKGVPEERLLQTGLSVSQTGPVATGTPSFSSSSSSVSLCWDHLALRSQVTAV